MLPSMKTIYYWVENQTWCFEEDLLVSIESNGKDYHITHVNSSSSNQAIQDLVHVLTR